MIRYPLLTIALLTALTTIGCAARDPWPGTQPGQLKVLASFPPLYCFTSHVAGDNASVRCLLTGTGPHDYNAPSSDSLKVATADLFIVNGLELDSFVAKLARNSGNPKKDLVFTVGDALEHKMLVKLKEDERIHYHEDGGKCVQGEHDPHIWLGPVHAAAIVTAIAKKLAAVDPAHAKNYEERGEAYVKKIEELHAYGTAQLKGKKNLRIITTHDSLRYFAPAYGIEIVGSIQPRAGTEAGAGQLAKLAELCKEKDVRAIMIEPQYSSGAAESLKKHLAAQNHAIQLVEFDPMETAAARSDGNPDPDLYLSRMRQNLDNLAKALP